MVASPSPQLSAISRLQIHPAGEFCPYCEQPIPNEKAEQVRARTEAKERELSERVTARLTQSLSDDFIRDYKVF
jgi:DNA repair exonuclease SbcCD ATPase subunit